jgi:hypothetical protein
VGNTQPFSATETATFPAAWTAVGPRPIAQCLVDSDYLINLPIIKAHSTTYTTLGLKHHWGSVDNCKLFHTNNYFAPTSNPTAQVELFKNKHLSGKTVLTVGDLLFGNWASELKAPLKWKLYGNAAANSLVVSADTVAFDCVMTDVLSAERALQGAAYGAFPAVVWTPLQAAAAAGFGTYEKGDPTQTPIGSGYSKIQYVYIDGVA